MMYMKQSFDVAVGILLPCLDVLMSSNICSFDVANNNIFILRMCFLNVLVAMFRCYKGLSDGRGPIRCLGLVALNGLGS